MCGALSVSNTQALLRLQFRLQTYDVIALKKLATWKTYISGVNVHSMFVISFHTIIYTQHSGVWRNSVREFGAIPFGSLAAKLTILSVLYCIPYVLLFFFKTSSPHNTIGFTDTD